MSVKNYFRASATDTDVLHEAITPQTPPRTTSDSDVSSRKFRTQRQIQQIVLHLQTNTKQNCDSRFRGCQSRLELTFKFSFFASKCVKICKSYLLMWVFFYFHYCFTLAFVTPSNRSTYLALLSCYLMSFVNERSEVSLNDDNVLVPIFDTKVTEYLCSRCVFFSSDKFRLFNKQFLTESFYIIQKVLLS